MNDDKETIVSQEETLVARVIPVSSSTVVPPYTSNPPPPLSMMVMMVWRSGGSGRMGWDVNEPPKAREDVNCNDIRSTFFTRIADPSSVGFGARRQHSTFLLLLKPLHRSFFFFFFKQCDLLIAILMGVLAIDLDVVIICFC